MALVKANCKYCNKTFEFYDNPSQRRKGAGKYCSITCKNLDGREDVTCKQCGRQFTRAKSLLSTYSKRKTTNDYCSAECYDAYRMQSVDVVCEICEKTFQVWRSRFERGNVRFCSKACSNKGNSLRFTQLIKTCEVCSAQFVVDKSHKQQRFCSSSCYGVWRSKSGLFSGEGNHRYRDGSTPRTLQRTKKKEWKVIAERIRNERGNVCEVCGSQGSERGLPVHHKIPWEVSHDDSDENLMVVCQSCHVKLDNVYYYSGVVPY